MKEFFIMVCSALLIIGCTSQKKLVRTVKVAEEQTQLLLKEVQQAKKNGAATASGATPGSGQKPAIVPRTLEYGQLKLVSAGDWTSGFFPGTLWYLFELSGKEEWKAWAQQYTALLKGEKYNGTTHDMGFKINSSFGNGYRLTDDPHYKEVMVKAAKTLATRFNTTTRTLRSWDHNRDRYGFPVIIDNMLNLELLFEATRMSGDSSYHFMAISHADQTLANHFRQNNSTFHVVDYDTVTGKPAFKKTHQGFSDQSAWARGQSWALYGFTMCYRYTRDPRYLQQAEAVAQFIFTHPRLPADKVPYWDFDDPAIPNAPRDASAAAVNASALLELSGYSSRGNDYKALAGKVLNSLVKHYMAAPGEAKGFILLHSTGHKPVNSEVDVPLNYADYYFLEALQRQLKLQGREK